jgi:uncharacterized protein YndB with AHSA1/START domain
MSTQTAGTYIWTSVVVDAPIERAFRVFTEDFGHFKPREHNLLAVEIAETVFEPRVGGHLYDLGVDGSECRFARVLADEPPRRVVLGWEISPNWQLEIDPTKTSEVEVRFTAEAANRTTGGSRTPQPRATRRGLGRSDGWSWRRRGLAALSRAVCRPAGRRGLTRQAESCHSPGGPPGVIGADRDSGWVGSRWCDIRRRTRKRDRITHSHFRPDYV